MVGAELCSMLGGNCTRVRKAHYRKLGVCCGTRAGKDYSSSRIMTGLEVIRTHTVEPANKEHAILNEFVRAASF